MPLAQGNPVSIAIWSAVLLGLVIAAFALVSWVKRKLQDSDEAPSAGFTLSDLRELHRQGKLSAEEFEKAKAAMVSAVRLKEGARKGPTKNG